MKISSTIWLDALCGEYAVGTLRGLARRRFERALKEEPPVAARLQYWQSMFAPAYADAIEVSPSPALWKRLELSIGLARYRTPWHKRMEFWRIWAVGATAALALAVGLTSVLPTINNSTSTVIAQLAGKTDIPAVTAALSADNSTLQLHAARPIIAGPNQSYELWLLPPQGDPISLAVLGDLDARFAIPTAQHDALRSGAKLAISVEPAGGSPSGKPTGPVILVGDIKA